LLHVYLDIVLVSDNLRAFSGFKTIYHSVAVFQPVSSNLRQGDIGALLPIEFLKGFFGGNAMNIQFDSVIAPPSALLCKLFDNLGDFEA
jgi:hypothetical protein